jgi:rhodanese-related sulfurtransferase
MSKGKIFIIGLLVVFAGAECASTKKASLWGGARITKDELRANLDNDGYVIIDVRIPSHYDGSDEKIKGAVRENPMDVSFWYPYPKDKTIVLYCAWPGEDTSARVALELMEIGYSKVLALKGGWREWKASGYPVEPK